MIDTVPTAVLVCYSIPYNNYVVNVRTLENKISKIKNLIAKPRSETNFFTPQTLKLIKKHGRSGVHKKWLCVLYGKESYSSICNRMGLENYVNNRGSADLQFHYVINSSIMTLDTHNICYWEYKQIDDSYKHLWLQIRRTVVVMLETMERLALRYVDTSTTATEVVGNGNTAVRSSNYLHVSNPIYSLPFPYLLPVILVWSTG